MDVYTPGAKCSLYCLEPTVWNPAVLNRTFRVSFDSSGSLSVIMSRGAVMSPAQPTVTEFTLTQVVTMY